MRGRLLLLAAVPALLAGCTLAPTEAPGDGPFASCPHPCQIPVDTTPDQSMEPNLAAHPFDGDHIVAATAVFDNGAPLDMKVHVSFDGGANFDTRPFPGELEPTHPLAKYTDHGDPALAILEDGTVLLSGVSMTGTRQHPHDALGDVVAFDAMDAWVAVSDDGGLTWPHATIVARGAGTLGSHAAAGIIQDQPWIAAGRGAHADTVLATWITMQHLGTPLERQDIHASVSRDGGRSWDEGVLLAQGGLLRNARPAIADDGTFYVVMRDWSTDPDAMEVTFARSSDGGRSWSTERLDGITTAASTPIVAEGDRVHFVSAQRDDRGFDTVTLHTSGDGGATWSARSLDEPEAVGEPLPALTADAAGHLFVSWYHALPDGKHVLYISEVAPDGTITRQVGNRTEIGEHGCWGFICWSAMGDYMGIAGLDRGAVAIWIGGEAPDTDVFMTRVGT